MKYVSLRILLRGNFDRYPLNIYIIPDKMCVNIPAKNVRFPLYICSVCKQQHAAVVYCKEMQCDACVQNIVSSFLFWFGSFSFFMTAAGSVKHE